MAKIVAVPVPQHIKINMHRNLTTSQIETVLTTSQLETIVNKSKAKGFLRLNLLDLSSVDPQVLAKSVLDTEFHEVELRETNLTKTQLETIFTKVAVMPSEGISLTGLNISQNDLSEVHPKIMAKAVIKINQVELNDTSLSMEQAEVLFKEIIESNNLNIDYMTVDKHICEEKNYELANAVAKKIELVKDEVRYEELEKDVSDENSDYDFEDEAVVKSPFKRNWTM